MTSNQSRAMHLAHDILNGLVKPETLSESDWGLLVLAAGTRGSASPPGVVSRRVLDNACTRSGFFHSPNMGPAGNPVLPN